MRPRKALGIAGTVGCSVADRFLLWNPTAPVSGLVTADDIVASSLKSDVYLYLSLARCLAAALKDLSLSHGHARATTAGL